MKKKTVKNNVKLNFDCRTIEAGAEYLVYLPDGGKVTVDLTATPGPLVAEWFDPKTGKTVKDDSAVGGARREFKAPFAGDAVLYLAPSFRANP